jgi:beta-phosphoglucomutase
MLKGVIFDMDGVIVDSHPIHIKAWKRFFASVWINPADDELEIVREGRKKEEILQHFLSGLTEDQIRQYAQEKDRLYRDEAADLMMIEGVEQLLSKLHQAGIPAAVASSGSSWRVRHTLDLLHLGDRFSTVVAGDEFKAGKSDSAIFQKTAQQMQVRFEESLVFEDSVSGVRSASAIGMKCLGIADCCRAEALLNAGAKHVYPNFVDTQLSELQNLFAESSGRENPVYNSISTH